jgi:hypothetical protein
MAGTDRLPPYRVDYHRLDGTIVPLLIPSAEQLLRHEQKFMPAHCARQSSAQ